MRVDLPAAFVERIAAEVGAELPAFLDALLSPEAGLRVNTLRIDADRFTAISPFDLAAIPFIREGRLVTSREPTGTHPHHAAGLYYLQDPGAMVVGGLLDPRPGERVLDLAAAPGGKATHLAARMGNSGVLVANDPHPGRAWELVGNIERLGITNAIVTSERPERLASRFAAYFDRVLVDAPCSGESMFHKSPVAREQWSPAAVQGCARRQTDILAAAARMVAGGGLLVYSTCTFAREENEEVVERFLDRNPDYLPEPLPFVPGAEPVRVRSAAAPPIGGLRLWPHRFPGAGHSIFALRRRTVEPMESAPRAATRVTRSAAETFAAFARAHFPDREVPDDRLVEHGRDLYLPPLGAPRMDGLRVLRSGVLLGAARKHGFDPAHALALAAFPGGSGARVDLSSTDDRVHAYLRGEAIRAEGESGWTIVAVDGFALGWGKRTGDLVKNHYPKGLRRPG